MNALSEQARGRTRADVASIRHLYLDFDENGPEAIERLQSGDDIPKPNYLVNTSPDHWQVSWKVSGFGNEQAETAMRELVREPELRDDDDDVPHVAGRDDLDLRLPRGNYILCLAVFRLIVFAFAKSPRRHTRTQLQSRLFLVIGELYHARRPDPSKQSQCLVIPDRGLYSDIHFSGPQADVRLVHVPD